ncbi:MAG: winged helix-turn-helix domain-containing protein [Paracoccaceae bacterium]|nr:winged helix-turn-helix domain-containing protein [Paracoccaceae bacterium]
MESEINPKDSRKLAIGACEFRFDPAALMDAGGQEIPLRPKTLEVLALLASQPNEQVSKDEIFQTVWTDTFVTDDSLVQCISEIRKALGHDGKDVIQTLPKKGYRLNASGKGEDSQNFRPKRARRPFWRYVAAVLAIALAGVLGWQNLGPVHPPALPARDGPARVAVLPFLNASGDSGQDFFVDGISEDLTVDLSNLSDLNVVSRGAVYNFRTPDRDPIQIAQDLNVDFLVDGAVRRVGEELRITVQLVDGQNGTNAWAGRFEGSADEIFELQSSVLTDLTRIIAVRLSPQERERLGIRDTKNVLAYDELLKGIYAESRFNRPGNAQAIDHYTAATRIDPNYGRAYSRLANIHLNNLRVGWGADRDSSIQLAIALAEKGVELSPESPIAWWTLARILPRLQTQEALARAIAANDKTLELSPEYRDGWTSRAWLMISSGKPEQALKAIKRAMAVPDDFPYFYWHALGMTNYFLGNYDAAIEALETAVSQNPNEIFVRWGYIAALARAGRIDDAEWEVEEVRALGYAGDAAGLFSASLIVHKPYHDDLLDALRLAGFDE